MTYNALRLVQAATEPLVQKLDAPVSALREYLRKQPEQERAFKVRTYTITFYIPYADHGVHVSVSNTVWDRDVLVTFAAEVYNDFQPGIYARKYKHTTTPSRLTAVPRASMLRFPDFVKALTADAIRCADERYEELKQQYGKAQATAEPQSDREEATEPYNARMLDAWSKVLDALGAGKKITTQGKPFACVPHHVFRTRREPEYTRILVRRVGKPTLEYSLEIGTKHYSSRICVHQGNGMYKSSIGTGTQRTAKDVMTLILTDAVQRLAKPVTAAAEPQSDREYVDRHRFPYEAVRYLAERTGSFSVNGMHVSVAPDARWTYSTGTFAQAVLVFDNHGDKFNVRVNSSPRTGYATVFFDNDDNNGAGNVHHIESIKLKDANPKMFIIELLKVCGLHHNASTTYRTKTGFEDDIPEFVDGFLHCLLQSIGDRTAEDFDENNNSPALAKRWETFHVSRADQDKSEAIARSFYRRAAPGLREFLEAHGQNCMPEPKDLGCCTAQVITGGSDEFVDLPAPPLTHPNRGWYMLMEHLDECARSVVGPIHSVDGEVRNGVIYFTWSGSARASA